MEVKITSKGDFNKTFKFLEKMKNFQIRQILERYGQEGVSALSSATPTDTGTTANSWSYEIESNGDTHAIYWSNSHTNKGVNIAIILQYGHGTRNGGWVESRDYINPAIDEVFKGFANALWVEITKP